MTRERARVALVVVPGLVIAVLSLIGLTPTGRDLTAYFFPLRQATAEVIAGERSGFWLREAGCGEPFFANPQSAVLYPPAWLGVVLPAHRAVGVEIGFHLALLALGAALLARRLGASEWWPVVAGLGVALAGPTLDSAGVLNNLTTLTWLPWLWWATLRGSPKAMAAFVALAVLAGEPQLAAAGVAVALTLGPLRCTVVPLVLGGALVAVQVLPFLAWAAGGDRTLLPDPRWAVAGALGPGELLSVVFPGAGGTGTWQYVPNVTLPVWVVAAALWSLVRGDRLMRRAVIWALVFLGLAAVPGLAFGGELWLAVSRGLVRYPGRWLFLTVVLLIPVAAAAASRLHPRPLAGLIVGTAAWVLGLGAGSGVADSGIGAAAFGSIVAFAGTPGALAALVASAALAPAPLRDLGPKWSWQQEAVPCLAAQWGPFRVYSVQYSRFLADWIAQDSEARGVGLGLGYQVLGDGRLAARSYGPLSPRAATVHLDEADRGPAGRWWLDALGAARFVSYQAVPGLPVICRERGILVMDNPQAWPLVSVARRVPKAGELPVLVGSVEPVTETGGRRTWRVEATEPGVLLWLETPDPGWRAWVDGRSSPLLRGPGIVQAIPVAAGEHVVEARYRPPGLRAGLVISLLALVFLPFLGQHRRESVEISQSRGNANTQ